MTTSKKVIIIVGSALVGALGGAAIAFPDLSVIFASVSGLVGLIVATITGVSLVKGD